MSGKAAWLVGLAACGCTVQTLSVNEKSPADSLFELTANWPAYVQAPAGQAPRGTIDILFMVDNSSSMAPLQGQLLAGFDTFMNVLDSVPGGTPDMHIGVISSDMGAATVHSEVRRCRRRPGAPPARGERGLRQRGHGAALPTISEASGLRVTNFTRPLPQEFACLARLGDTGCGFEHRSPR